MFIVHTNGHPVVFKTNRGARFVAFGSLEDGRAFLRWKQAPCTLDTLDEILKLNPRAFPPEFSVIHLSTRQAIDMFANDPKGFPTEEFLVMLRHDVVPSEPPAPPPTDSGQNELKF
jgi:hypothetical protein